MSTSNINEPDNQAYEFDNSVLFLLGQVSRKHREALKMTVAQLGKCAAIDPFKILQLESGEWDIDLVSLFSITRCLGTTAAAVFEEMEKNAGQLFSKDRR